MRHAVFIFLLASSSLARAETGKDLLAQMLPSDALLPNAQSLGLSADQQQRLREGILPMQREVVPLQDQLRALNARLVGLLAVEKPDDAAVLAQFAEVEVLESRIKVLRLKMTLLAKQVLSAEQQTKALALRGGSAPEPGDGSIISGKLQRVRDGIERMKREGRDVTRVRELWDEFQKRAELRHHQLAMQALNEALSIVESQN